MDNIGLAKETPEGGAALVTDDGTRPEGKHSGQAASFAAEAWVAYRVHPAMNTVKAPRSHAPANPSAADTHGLELGGRDHAVLPPG
jgi:hypothetical protein